MDVNELDELAQAKAKSKTHVNDLDFPDDGAEELLATQDVIDAMVLLRTCQTLLRYVSDVELCQSLTKRERGTMSKVAGYITTFLDEKELHYEMEEFDG